MRRTRDELAVMLCAASKTYNVAGLAAERRLICENEKMRERDLQRRFTACGVKSGNVFALAATRAAYTGLRRVAGRA